MVTVFPWTVLALDCAFLTVSILLLYAFESNSDPTKFGMPHIPSELTLCLVVGFHCDYICTNH